MRGIPQYKCKSDILLSDAIPDAALFVNQNSSTSFHIM